MQRHIPKFVFVLALVAIAALGFVSTAELLHHHHDNISERVCPLCHPPLIGLQPAALTEVDQWLAYYRRFMDESFDRLEEELRKSAKNKEESHGASRKARRK